MDWSAEAFLRSSSSKEALWAEALERAINFEDQIGFTRIASKQYVGLALFLFARHGLVGAVHDIGGGIGSLRGDGHCCSCSQRCFRVLADHSDEYREIRERSRFELASSIVRYVWSIAISLRTVKQWTVAIRTTMTFVVSSSLPGTPSKSVLLWIRFSTVSTFVLPSARRFEYALMRSDC